MIRALYTLLGTYPQIDRAISVGKINTLIVPWYDIGVRPPSGWDSDGRVLQTVVRYHKRVNVVLQIVWEMGWLVRTGAKHSDGSLALPPEGRFVYRGQQISLPCPTYKPWIDKRFARPLEVCREYGLGLSVDFEDYHSRTLFGGRERFYHRHPWCECQRCKNKGGWNWWTAEVGKRMNQSPGLIGSTPYAIDTIWRHVRRKNAVLWSQSSYGRWRRPRAKAEQYALEGVQVVAGPQLEQHDDGGLHIARESLREFGGFWLYQEGPSLGGRQAPGGYKGKPMTHEFWERVGAL